MAFIFKWTKIPKGSNCLLGDVQTYHPGIQAFYNLSSAFISKLAFTWYHFTNLYFKYLLFAYDMYIFSVKILQKYSLWIQGTSIQLEFSEHLLGTRFCPGHWKGQKNVRLSMMDSIIYSPFMKNSSNGSPQWVRPITHSTAATSLGSLVLLGHFAHPEQ